MALTECEDCGREVSTQARACPGCGCPIAGDSAPPDVTTGTDRMARGCLSNLAPLAGCLGAVVVGTVVVASVPDMEGETAGKLASLILVVGLVAGLIWGRRIRSGE